jgi:OmpA-OmpF porin, OOP family
MMYLRNFFVVMFLLVSTISFSQEQDVEGSQDHPLLTRMNNFFIGEYETNFDRVDMYISDGEEKGIEGDKTYLYYFFDENSGKKCPSPFQILKNYELAIKKIGGRVVYTDNSGIGTYQIKKDGKESWVKLHAVNQGYAYYLTVVEVNRMEQEITASGLYGQLTEVGSVSLYINFDVGKSTIKTESLPVIDQLVQMLQENGELNISIEGHTDNIGSPAANKTLSLQRAKAVMTAITNKGVSAIRIKTQGWGQEKPIAENSSEEGRAQNRRVEIVKI